MLHLSENRKEALIGSAVENIDGFSLMNYVSVQKEWQV